MQKPIIYCGRGRPPKRALLNAGSAMQLVGVALVGTGCEPAVFALLVPVGGRAGLLMVITPGLIGRREQ